MPCSFWHYDDITRCGREGLDLYAPLAIGLLSISVLAVTFLVAWNSRSRSSPESEPLLPSDARDVYGTNPESFLTLALLKDRHFDLAALLDTNIDGTPHGRPLIVPKDAWERARVASEFVLVSVQLVLLVSLFLAMDWPREIAFAKSLFWGYAFVLVTSRLVNINRVWVKLPGLWIHSATLYFMHFIPSVITFRLALINPSNASYFYYADFLCTMALVLIVGTARTSDSPGVIYATSDGIRPLPEPVSSIFSLATYSWIDPMVWKAFHSPLSMHDIWGLRQDDYALPIVQGFQASKLAAKFSVKLFAHFKWLFAIQAFYAVLQSLLIFGPSILLKYILEYVDQPSSLSRALAWTFVILMPLFKITDAISAGCSLFLGRRVCIRMRAIIIGQVYAKALRRKITVSQKEAVDASKDDASASPETDDTESTTKTAELGAIINLMSIDAFKVSEMCGYLHYFVSAVLQIAICIVLLYALLGWLALVGALSIIALLPVNFKIAKWIGALQKKNLAVTDKRIQMLNETFSSIRIIKFFAWESKFYENIIKVRGEELHYLKLRMIAWSVGSFMWFVTPTLITLLLFYCYTIIEGRTLTAPIAFTALSLFTLLRAPLDQLLDMTAFVIQCKVSLDRVGEFLDEGETSKYDQLDHPHDSASAPLIGFTDNASFAWDASNEIDFRLRDLNVAFLPGKLNVIIGGTGLGKSSLMLALLGEMDLIRGGVYLPGTIPRDDLIVDPHTGLTELVAYCAQLAWLLNETIRNNITFGALFNEQRYNKVIEACGLTRDLEILPAGDATEVGEKGITLSGGQKQRVSIARALYSNSRHILLDDCLSAVDAHTASWIYENCICGPLMERRTCILVSHNVALTVQNAEFVVVMDSGRITAQGSPEELLKTGSLGDDDLVKTLVMNSRLTSTTDLAQAKADLKENAAVIDAKLKKIALADQDEVVKSDGKLTEEETKAEGSVGWSVYAKYAENVGGKWAWLLLLLVFIVSQGIYMYQLWWLREWLNESSAAGASVFELSRGSAELPWPSFKAAAITSWSSISSAVQSLDAYKSEHSAIYYIQVYAVIGLAYALSASFRVYITFLMGIIAANRIFKRVLKTILHAKLRFFDKTPQGRIMNRFSKDMEAVDQELTPFAEVVFICVVLCLLTLILITVITPAFLIFAFAVLALYYFIGVLYITLSRELKRFESITKSPIHQHFSESLLGVATIRAYGVESRFMKQNLKAIDDNNRPFFYLWVDNRWLSFRTDAAGALIMFFSGMLVLASVGKIDAGLAGLSLSYAISFSESALWIVRLASNLEMNMNSAERLQEFIDVEQEAPYEIPETEPSPDWPLKGAIEVENVSLRYAPELPRVIKDISFSIEPNNKVGIVGRTGAGKSTIITAFFRFLDPEQGRIVIDGVDITKIGLRNLREAITIIPQDPTLFAGTIRSNLDPFNRYDDDLIFRALKRVNLIGEEESAGSGAENVNKFLNLDSNVAEGGGNLSQGERQLVCLSRSLLKNPKIMLLDEATSSIDYKLDSIIQRTIREEFSNSTIVTIAHRLRTIIDYDKILVMDAGRVVEYDNPYVLIANKDSLFYSMCLNSGELDTLVKLAKQAYVDGKNLGNKR